MTMVISEKIYILFATGNYDDYCETPCVASTNKLEIDKIKESEEPQAAIEYVKKNHKDVLEKEYFKMTDAKGMVTYGIKVKDKKLIFDTKGNYLKSEDCKE